MSEPAGDMAPGPDGRVPGTSATVMDLGLSLPVADPEMDFGAPAIPASGSLIH